MEQLELVASAKTEAIARVYEAADPEWIRAAKRAICKIARALPEFTTDEIWSELEGSGYVTHEPRALGAIMHRAAAADVIRKKDCCYRPSKRDVCHSRPVQVWTKGGRL